MIVKLTHQGGNYYLEAEEVRTWVTDGEPDKIRVVRLIYPNKRSESDPSKTLFIGLQHKDAYKGTPWEDQVVYEQGWIINKEGKTIDTLNQPMQAIQGK